MLRKRILMVLEILANVAVISSVIILFSIFSSRLGTLGLNILPPSATGTTLFSQRSSKTIAPGESATAIVVKGVSFTASELRGEMENNRDIVILDIRSREEFARGHIPFSVNIPHDEILSRALDELPESKLLVISSFECSNDELSSVILDELNKLGFTNVAILKSGIDGWTQTGFKTERAAYSEPRIYTLSDQPSNESALRR